jgi:hypothetical protein
VDRTYIIHEKLHTHTHTGSITKLEGKRPLGRHGYVWEDNVELDLKEVECEGLKWIHL